nr:LysM domain-containing protein [Geobacter pickeringii]
MRLLSARLAAALAFTTLALAASPEHARAIDPRFELDPRLLDSTGEASHRGKAVKKARKGAKAEAGISEYTIRPGDHIFKILMRDYGLSNDEAEALVPEVKRLNGISDIRRLRVGQSIRIPLAPGVGTGTGERPARGEEARRPERVERPAAAAPVAAGDGDTPVAGHSLRMMSVAAARAPEGVLPHRQPHLHRRCRRARARRGRAGSPIVGRTGPFPGAGGAADRH